MSTPQPQKVAAHHLGSLFFWLAVCLGLGAICADLDGSLAWTALLGFAALAVAGLGVCAGLIEWDASRQNL